MKKKLLEKRIDLFKKCFPEYKVSKKGSLYFSEILEENTRNYEYRSDNTTKGNLHKLGQEIEIPNNIERVILITKTGRLMFKGRQDKSFSPVSFKKFRRIKTNYPPLFVDLFFVGRKYEWMKQFPNFWEIRCFENFNSLKEAKTFLGYDFVSKNVFSKLNGYKVCHLIDFKFKYKVSREVLKALFDNCGQYDRLNSMYRFRDYLDMLKDLNLEPEKPLGKQHLRRLHDDAVDKLNSMKIQDLPDIEYIYGGELISELSNSDLDFTILASEKALRFQGRKQKHCLGGGGYHEKQSRGDRLFLSVEHNDNDYEAEIGHNQLIQFRGKRNTAPPKKITSKLTKLVSENDWFCIPVCSEKDKKQKKMPEHEILF